MANIRYTSELCLWNKKRASRKIWWSPRANNNHTQKRKAIARIAFGVSIPLRGKQHSENTMCDNI